MQLTNSDQANVNAIVTGGLAAWLVHPLAGIGVGTATYLLTRYPYLLTRYPSLLHSLEDLAGPIPGTHSVRALKSAWGKMRKDFSQSSLRSNELLDGFDQETRYQLGLAFGDVSTRLLGPPNEIIENAWRGEPIESLVAQLRSEIDVLGRPIRISACSISVAVISVLKGFSQRGLSIDLVLDSASGVIQAKSAAKATPFDFVVAADAPFFLCEPQILEHYHRMHEVSRETQGILRRIGKRGANSPLIWTYPDSSATLQLRLARQKIFPKSYQIPVGVREKPASLSGIPICCEYMKPGDYIFAWEPLLSMLAENDNLELLKDSRFDLTISLFCNQDHRSNTKLLEAFSNMFIAEWNYCSKHLLIAWAMPLT